MPLIPAFRKYRQVDLCKFKPACSIEFPDKQGYPEKNPSSKNHKYKVHTWTTKLSTPHYTTFMDFMFAALTVNSGYTEPMGQTSLFHSKILVCSKSNNILKCFYSKSLTANNTNYAYRNNFLSEKKKIFETKSRDHTTACLLR